MSQPRTRSPFCGGSSRFDRVFFGFAIATWIWWDTRWPANSAYLLLYVLLVVVVACLYLRLPSSYLPNEDQGVIMCQVMMPTGSTLDMTKEVADLVSPIFGKREGGGRILMSIVGTGFAGTVQNNAMVFVRLKDWKLRERAT